MAIDEYPLLARSCAAVSSELQQLIDEYKPQGSRMKLILCGSSISYMEDEVLAYKAPLYGRKTAQIKVEAFDFPYVRAVLKDFSFEEQALYYGILGGTPYYLERLDPKLSLEDNLCELLISSEGFLYEEPQNLLRHELREPSVYNDILTAIARGASRQVDIANKISMSANVLSSYLRQLMLLGLITRETPYGEKNSKRTIYQIEDLFFRFYHTFILDVQPQINHGQNKDAWKQIKPRLSHYMVSIFERICMQYLWYLKGRGFCPVKFIDLGRWWGTDPKLKAQTEIDIMGAQDDSCALFAECDVLPGAQAPGLPNDLP